MELNGLMADWYWIAFDVMNQFVKLSLSLMHVREFEIENAKLNV